MWMGLRSLTCQLLDMPCKCAWTWYSHEPTVHDTLLWLSKMIQLSQTHRISKAIKRLSTQTKARNSPGTEHLNLTATPLSADPQRQTTLAWVPWLQRSLHEGRVWPHSNQTRWWNYCRVQCTDEIRNHVSKLWSHTCSPPMRIHSTLPARGVRN